MGKNGFIVLKTYKMSTGTISKDFHFNIFKTCLPITSSRLNNNLFFILIQRQKKVREMLLVPTHD